MKSAELKFEKVDVNCGHSFENIFGDKVAFSEVDFKEVGEYSSDS